MSEIQAVALSVGQYFCEIEGDTFLIPASCAYEAGREAARMFDKFNREDSSWRVLVKPQLWDATDTPLGEVELVITRHVEYHGYKSP